MVPRPRGCLVCPTRRWRHAPRRCRLLLCARRSGRPHPAPSLLPAPRSPWQGPPCLEALG
eukprot:11184183-Lingulodinium_polyedra.AAC.1